MEPQGKQRKRQHRSLESAGIQIAVLSMLLLCVFGLTIWNAANLKGMLYHSTQSYVQDVSYQLADGITARMKSNQQDMELLADSLVQTKERDIAALLTHKAQQIPDFDAFAWIDQQGNTMIAGEGIVSSLEYPGIENAFAGENSVTCIEGQNILYAVPVYQNGEVGGVLAGIRGKGNMQELIQPKSFQGRGMTCIINRDGEVIISPTDLKPFQQLDSIFKSDEETAEKIQNMRIDLGRGRDGAFRFRTTDGIDLILCYHTLEIEDWVLLTLVPADLIAGEAGSYIFWTFLTVAGIIILFALFLLAIIRFYRGHRRQIEEIAFIDPVTGGMTNAAFQLKAQEILQRDPPNSHAIVMFNIRGFKLINENFGIAAGNDVLRYIHSVLQRHLKKEELVARSAADNFFLCLQENAPRVIQQRLDRMVEEVNSFNEGQEEPYYLDILQGAYIVDDPQMEIGILQDRARTAYQAAKEESHPGRCVFYDTALTERMQLARELCNLFEKSIENGDFQMYLQPKVRLSDGKVGGAEALVRWEHPQRGRIFPCDFIPLFERNGQICRLDLYMFEHVCAVIQRWRREGRPLIPISINLSRQHFKKEGFLFEFIQIAKRYEIPDGVLELELTENVFFDDQMIRIVKHTIHQMHKAGFLCSLDDFGSGFSSLGLLQEFAVDTIKLDRKFFQNMDDARSWDIISALIGLAKQLHISTVAEGIEAQDQLKYLKELHCELVQGYLFSKPLELTSFERWWEDWETQK